MSLGQALPACNRAGMNDTVGRSCGGALVWWGARVFFVRGGYWRVAIRGWACGERWGVQWGVGWARGLCRGRPLAGACRRRSRA